MSKKRMISICVIILLSSLVLAYIYYVRYYNLPEGCESEYKACRNLESLYSASINCPMDCNYYKDHPIVVNEDKTVDLSHSNILSKIFKLFTK